MNMLLDERILKQVALEMGIKDAFVEKDWFVTQTIKILSENQYLDFSIIFTGGTALSKAHRIIERFSEDVDFRVYSASLDDLSASQKRKKLSGFKKHVENLLGQAFVISKIDARDSNRYIIIDLVYPSICEPAKALRPHIKLEFTLSKLALPGVYLPVSSFINEVSGKPPEIKKILCTNPVENAADKFSAIAWRIPSRVRGENDKQQDIVRHLHDLAKLSEQAFKSADFALLVKTTIEQDADRGDNETKALSPSEKLSKTMSILENDPEYPKEYERFVNVMSYSPGAALPTYQEAISKVRLLAEKVITQVNRVM